VVCDEWVGAGITTITPLRAFQRDAAAAVSSRGTVSLAYWTTNKLF
jgi:hypothetical protein